MHLLWDLCLWMLSCSGFSGLQQKCVKFNKASNSSKIASVCSQFLSDTCTTMQHQMTFNILTERYGVAFENISLEIIENCNCRNRWKEIFCRFLLPQCSISDENAQCDALTCMTSTIARPCSDYCHTFVSR